jgi:hypothetical protein
MQDGKEHYVFFAFPHIAINSAGEVGAITRPGRPNKSCACGALAKALGELKAEGYECNCKVPGVHDPLDPEYSILKQRLARRARYEKMDVSKLDLVSITKLAERTISTDMEFLAEKVVDTRKANYAVVTGVQIHNWATELTPESGVPSIEFVHVAQCHVVINGVKTHLDLAKVPPLSPRQLQLMARASMTSPVVYDDDEIMISKTKTGELGVERCEGWAVDGELLEYGVGRLVHGGCTCLAKQALRPACLPGHVPHCLCHWYDIMWRFALLIASVTAT